MVSRLIYVVLLMLLVSCKDNAPPPPPENALDEEKFVTVMVDMHLAEAAINQKFTQVNDSTSVAYRYYKHLFAKHEINKTDFDSTFNYYLRYPGLMLEIYEQVNDSLVALSQDLEVNEEKYRKMEKADTLQADTLKEITLEELSAEKE